MASAAPRSFAISPGGRARVGSGRRARLPARPDGAGLEGDLHFRHLRDGAQHAGGGALEFLLAGLVLLDWPAHAGAFHPEGALPCRAGLDRSEVAGEHRRGLEQAELRHVGEQPADRQVGRGEARADQPFTAIQRGLDAGEHVGQGRPAQRRGRRRLGARKGQVGHARVPRRRGHRPSRTAYAARSRVPMAGARPEAGTRSAT